MAKRNQSSKSAHQGRVTPKGGERNTKVGRYRSPEESGRITARIPENVKHSPPWWGKTALGLLIGGLVLMLGNWMTVWPGAYSPWYLVGGLATSAVGFGMLTRYH
jgi:hypothetical protein